MKLFVIASLVAAAGFVLAGSDDAGKTDLKKMAGKWRLVSYSKDGKPTPEDKVNTTRTVFDADGSYTVSRDGQVVTKAKAKLDASKNPKQTDVTYSDGEQKGKTVLGIYKT